MASPAFQANARYGESSEPVTIALHTLAWILSDSKRADRLLALTGLMPEDLRARAADPALLASVITYLEAHEPDLIGCAEALGITPTNLIAAGRALA